MNPQLERLHSYPFEKLAALKKGANAPADLEHIALSIGEPQHPAPDWAIQTLTEHLDKLANYPTTRGLPQLRRAIAQWLEQRFQLARDSLDPESQILPVNGTREALFAFAQAMVDQSRHPLVAMPNPFYQIYEGAALLAGAEPWYMNCTEQSGFLPDFAAVDEKTWQRCQLLYLCSPGNPTGAVMSLADMQSVIELAHRHDFIIASDECYSEIYRDEANPPPGLLQAAADMGLPGFDRCVVFHSLSKRSNLPGLRSGFAAGDKQVMQRFGQYRTYHGCAMSLPIQMASIAAWGDEEHVRANRRAYAEKFEVVSSILGSCLSYDIPPAGFYLWPKTPVSDTLFSRKLYEQCNITVLPGNFLGRWHEDCNPGDDHVRIALVAPLAQCREAAQRIVPFVNSL